MMNFTEISYQSKNEDFNKSIIFHLEAHEAALIINHLKKIGHWYSKGQYVGGVEIPINELKVINRDVLKRDLFWNDVKSEVIIAFDSSERENKVLTAAVYSGGNYLYSRILNNQNLFTDFSTKMFLTINEKQRLKNILTIRNHMPFNIKVSELDLQLVLRERVDFIIQENYIEGI